MSFPSDADRRIETFKLDGDLRDAYVELLSAQCAVERLKTRYSPEDLAAKGGKFMVLRSMAATKVICEYFSSVQTYLRPQAGPCPKGQGDLFHEDKR